MQNYFVTLLQNFRKIIKKKTFFSPCFPNGESEMRRDELEIQSLDTKFQCWLFVESMTIEIGME